MIDIRFLHHGAHSVFYRSICKLIVCMLIPDCLKIKKGTIHELLEKSKVPSVGHSLSTIVEMILEGSSKEEILNIPIVILGHCYFSRGAVGFLPCQVAEERNIDAGDACTVSSIGI